MNQAVILVGNIGSGKTTLAKKYVEKGYFSVDQDSIRSMLGSGKYIFDLKLEPIIKEVSSLLMSRLCDAHVNIVLDGAFVNKEIRSRVIGIINRFPNYEIVAHVLPEVSQIVAVNRRMEHDSRGYHRDDWNKVYDKFEAKKEEVTIDEGFSKIIYDKEPKTGLPCEIVPFKITEEYKERQKELQSFLQELDDWKKRTDEYLKNNPIMFKGGGIRFDFDLKNPGTPYA